MSSSRGTSATVRLTPVADDLERAAGADPLLGHQALEVVDAADRQAVDADDQVLGAQAGAGGRRAVDHLDDLDRAVAAERRRDARRQRPGAARDADPGAPHAAVAHQRGDDPARRRVDRHGQAEADAGDRGVDPDHAAAAVDQRAARVAGVERGVGLDDVVDDARRAAGAGGQRAAERGDDAGGDRAGVAVRVADRHHELADAQRGRVAELGRLEARRLGAQDGEVGQRVGADEPRLELAAVDERGPHARAGARPRGRW